MSHKIPRPGQTIYVDTALHLSRGADDVLGGLATVSQVTNSMSGGRHTTFVSVLEHPGVSYNWDYLGPQQVKLKKEFKSGRARPDPDLRPEFNRWD